MKKCDIVIPVWNELESTRKCIELLKQHTSYPYRLVVVDNQSRSATKEYLLGLKDSFRDYILIRNEQNLGFVKAVNQGIVSSDSPYVLLLNNDTYVTGEWLSGLVGTVESGPLSIGCANPTSNDFGKSAPDGKKGEWQELDSCKGFCMLIKREVVKKIGLFDEAYGMGYYEEKDFSRRAIEAGFLCVRSKASFVFHADRLSFDKLENRDEIFKRSEEIYNKKWGKTLNVAIIAKDKEVLEERKEILYGLLDKGNRLHIFFSKDKPRARLKDHIQIRYFPLRKPLFNYMVLFKLWKRRRKKKIDIIMAREEKSFNFFKRYKYLHKAEVSKWNKSCRSPL